MIATQISVYEGEQKAAVGNYTYGTDLLVAIIQRSSGYFAVSGTTNFETAKLLWVSDYNSDDLESSVTLNDPSTPDDNQVVDLAAPFDSDFGLATQQLAGVRSSSDTFTHEPDFVASWASALDEEIAFRTVDVDNLLSIVIGSDGSISVNQTLSGSTITLDLQRLALYPLVAASLWLWMVRVFWFWWMASLQYQLTILPILQIRQAERSCQEHLQIW